MILPVVAYGHPMLRKIAQNIEKDYPDLNELIDNMFETMYSSNGVGLAAPQVNRSIKLFLVDTTPYAEEFTEAVNFKKVIINPQIIKEAGKKWSFNEGCLSIPDIREDVIRKPEIHIQYYDTDFKFHDETYDGVIARVIQHEYDHLEGILFVDKISSLRKTLLKRKLTNITNGKIKVNYKMIFPAQKKRNKSR